MQVKSCEVFMNAVGDLAVYTSAVMYTGYCMWDFPAYMLCINQVSPGFAPGRES